MSAPARPTPRWRRLSEWPVTAKVVAVLAIPALIAALFGAVQVGSQAIEASRGAAVVTQTGALTRAWEVLRAADDVALQTGPDAATNLKDTMADLAAARTSSSLSDAQRTHVDSILEAARAVDASPGAGAEASSVALGRAVSDLAGGIITAEPTVATRVSDFRELVIARIELGKQRNATVHPTLVVGVNRVVLATGIGAEAVALSRITVGGEAGDVVGGIVDRNRGRLAQLQASGVPAEQALTKTAERYDDAASLSIASLTDAADASSRAALLTALVVSGLVLILLLLGVAAALVIARSLSRSIETVRRGALEIAQEQLPQDVTDVLAGRELRAMTAIPVTSDEEVGQLARSVENMYGRARELATAQAALRQQVSGMFETLSRRSSALLDRQLSIVERLEQDEPNPKRLSALFELDHLAARMRRNGESLLVLAGARTRSTRGAELAVTDAVRAAASEVAQYQRVVVGDLGGRSVVGSLGSDLVHLLAELLDNALSYSSPQTEVSVVGARTTDGGLLIEIIDNGLGIEPAELASLNEVLRSTAELTPEAARRMGLYVVGRLATQHEITVTLHPNPRGGTVAAIALPAAALAAHEVPRAADRAHTASIPTSVPEDAPRLAPVSDLDAHIARQSASGAGDARPALARRSRGQADTPGPITSTVAAWQRSVPAPEETAPAPEAPVPARAPEAAAPAPDVAAAPTPDAPLTQPRHEPDSDEVAHALGVSDAEQPDPGIGAYSDTADPRTIRTWVTAASAEPGDDDVSDDRAPDVRAVAVTSHTGSGYHDVPETRAMPVVGAAAGQDAGEPIPVYSSTRSRWLTDTGSVALPWVDDDEELSRGRVAAARAERPVVGARTSSGLPRRAPGAQLVPGGVTAPEHASRRLDPQNVRESVNRHLSGVRRGRAAARSLGGADAQGE